MLNSSSRTGITVSADTDRMWWTIAQREYSQWFTNQYEPSAIGPKKSPPTTCHGPWGIGDATIGSYDRRSVFAWHAWHLFTLSSTISSMPGNQTRARTRAFVFSMPWCP
ncbi:hypothetical protein BpHYR1_015221, partial [Brachionus plicatilis]